MAVLPMLRGVLREHVACDIAAIVGTLPGGWLYQAYKAGRQ